ncbi:MAG: hypothetical protein ACRDRL_14255 [Sciscionella sp.]
MTVLIRAEAGWFGGTELRKDPTVWIKDTRVRLRRDLVNVAGYPLADPQQLCKAVPQARSGHDE